MIYTNINQVVSNVKDDLSDTLFSTLGPGGKNVLITNALNEIHFTKDGITILDSIKYFDNALKQAVLNIIKESSQRTFTEVGDGTTSTAIMAIALYEYLESLNLNIRDVKDLQDKWLSEFKENIEQEAIRHTPNLRDVAMTASNGNSKIVDIVLSAIESQGAYGTPYWEIAGYLQDIITTSYEGFTMDRGFVDSIFVNEPEKMRFFSDKESFVLLVEGRLERFNDIVDYYKQAVKLKTNLYVVAREFTPKLLLSFRENSRHNPDSLLVPIQSSGLGEVGKKTLEDLAIYLDTEVVTVETLPMKADQIKLGLATRLEITENNSIITTGIDTSDKVNERLDMLTALKVNKPPMIIRNINQRIRQLNSSNISILVGGDTEVQAKENYDVLDDTMKSVINVKDNGVIPGGGYAYGLAPIPKECKEYYKALLDRNYGRQITETTGVYDSVEMVYTVFKNALAAAVALVNIKSAIIHE